MKALFFCFQLEIPFPNKFHPKNQNCQLKLKLDTRTNFEYVLVVFPFSSLDQKYSFRENLVPKLSLYAKIWYLFRLEILFWGKFGLKSQNCQFKLKNWLNMQNSMVMFTFLFLTEINLFRQISSKTSKLLV